MLIKKNWQTVPNEYSLKLQYKMCRWW